MKKSLVAVALSAIITSGALAEEKSGVFVGATGGLGFVTGVILNTSGYQIAWKDNSVEETMLSETIGAKVGYQHWFFPMFGLRTYFQYDYNTGRSWNIGNQNLLVDFHQFTGNMDLMLNFINTESFSLGAFAGLGLGYTLSSWNKSEVSNLLDKTTNYSGFALPINVGISTTFAQQHKVELGARIHALPALYQNKGDSADLSGFGFGMMSVNIGYSYIL